MIKRIRDTDIHYIKYGSETGKPIVLLHGWGQNIEMMKPIGDAFQEEHPIFILDLPGYGKSPEPPYAWTVLDYVKAIYEWLQSCDVQNPILMGHSFGGKISLLYASMYPVSKLILFASPFKKEVEKLSFKTKVLKSVKKLPGMKNIAELAKKHMGSVDYRNASPKMREILVGTVNFDISKEVENIKCPTLIIWGTNDEAVPVERAYELEKRIADAGVVIYEGCTHYAYLEQLGKTIQVLQIFLKE